MTTADGGVWVGVPASILIRHDQGKLAKDVHVRAKLCPANENIRFLCPARKRVKTIVQKSTVYNVWRKVKLDGYS